MNLQHTLCLAPLLMLCVSCSSQNKPNHEPVQTTPLIELKQDPPTDQATSPETPSGSQSEGASSSTSAQATPYDEMPFYAQGPVAVIQGRDVTAKEYNQRARDILRRLQGRFSTALSPMYSKSVLTRLVEEELFKLDMAQAKTKVVVTQDELDQTFAAYLKRFTSEEDAENAFKMAGMTRADAKKEMRRALLTRKHLSLIFPLDITAKEIKAYYQENQKRYIMQEQRRARHILIKFVSSDSPQREQEALAKANMIAKLAKEKDADFAALAKQYSEGPSAPRGGDLGFFPARRMVKPFSEAAFKMKTGEVSGVVKTQFGFHIIKVTDAKKGRTKPLSEVQDGIKERLEAKSFKRYYKEHLEFLKGRYGLVMMPENIVINKSWTPPPAPAL